MTEKMTVLSSILSNSKHMKFASFIGKVVYQESSFILVSDITATDVRISFEMEKYGALDIGCVYDFFYISVDRDVLKVSPFYKYIF